MRKLLSIALLLIASFSLTACEDLLVECTGCDSTTPWSHPDATTCYPSKADCEAAEGRSCVICS